MTEPYDIVILGLSITSSWGNGHATTWRGLVQGLASRGHKILFLERETPWYSANRDEPHPAGATTEIYQSFEDLTNRFECAVRDASLVIVGSYVPQGILVGEWVTSIAGCACAFYDIDTPITLAQLDAGTPQYVTADLIGAYDAYLSFTGGPTLRRIENQYGSPMARELYCSVDCNMYQPLNATEKWDLGYLGTYSSDRQPLLDELLLEPARRWPEAKLAVAGPQYPDSIQWPQNVERFVHLPPAQHSEFYAAQRFTLNITREAMKKAGYSPSVRLFEAGACGVPVISDWWEGLDSVFKIGEEILVAETSEDTLRYLHDLPAARRAAIGDAMRRRVLAEHTPFARAAQLDRYLKEMNDHAVTDSARRNRRGGKTAGRLDARLAFKSEGQGTSETRIGDAGQHANSSDLCKSIGTNS